MSISFKQASFKTSGGTAARSLDAWFGDVINVKEMGALGNGVANDAPAIQAAFNLAFGSPPNGWTNRHLNRPVFFPAGRYNIEAPLTLTKVVGGHIYGAGKHATQIHYVGAIAGGATLTSLLNMNGCADLCIEKLYMEMHNSGAGGDNTCTINVGWDGDVSGNGCDGNHDNHFQELQLGGGQCVVIIGSNTASEGRSNLFVNCSVNGSVPRVDVGYDVRGPNAVNNQIIGGGGISHTVAFVRCPSGGGSIHAQGMSLGGGNTGVEFLMNSDKVMSISQCRSENVNLLRMTNGVVTVYACAGTGGMTGVAEINGGKCTIQGCDFHPVGQITGTGGQLYLAGTYFGSSVTPLSGYSGTKVWNPDGIT